MPRFSVPHPSVSTCVSNFLKFFGIYPKKKDKGYFFAKVFQIARNGGTADMAVINYAQALRAEEKRKKRRIYEQLSVQVTAGENSWRGNTKNVSASGLFIRFSDEILSTFVPEQQIDIRLILHNGDTCRLVGRIARIVLDDAQIIRHGIGVEIVGGEAVYQAKYSAFIRERLR